jgi:hypothetical protein
LSIWGSEKDDAHGEDGGCFQRDEQATPGTDRLR